jgi:transposase
MTTLSELGERRAKLRAELAMLWDELRVTAVAEVAAGRNESEVARDAGVDRMTVRKWQGKR